MRTSSSTFILFLFLKCSLQAKSKERGDQLATRSEIVDFPFLAALLCSNPGNKEMYNQICSGSIISKNFILTAAHCFDKHRKPYSVNCHFRVGHTNWFLGKVQKIQNVYIPKQWNSEYKEYGFDIAVVRVNTMTYSSKVKPIALLNTVIPLNDQTVQLIGWGLGGHDANSTKKNEKTCCGSRVDKSKLLYSMNSTVLSYEECVNLSCVQEEIKSFRFLCGEKGCKIPCKGDSGGPVIIYTSSKPVQVGIISYGDICGSDPTTPDHYTMVPYYLRWIYKKSTPRFDDDDNRSDLYEKADGDSKKPKEKESQTKFNDYEDEKPPKPKKKKIKPKPMNQNQAKAIFSNKLGEKMLDVEDNDQIEFSSSPPVTEKQDQASNSSTTTVKPKVKPKKKFKYTYVESEEIATEVGWRIDLSADVEVEEDVFDQQFMRDNWF